jgi:hypothetical protein
LLLYDRQPNGRRYLAFNFHRNTTRTAINDDNLGLNRARNKWKKKGILNVATWNVRGIVFEEDQLDDILAKKNIKIAAISETKKKFRGSKETNNYLQFYHGVGKKERAQAGVMLMIPKRSKALLTVTLFRMKE